MRSGHGVEKKIPTLARNRTSIIQPETTGYKHFGEIWYLGVCTKICWTDFILVCVVHL